MSSRKKPGPARLRYILPLVFILILSGWRLARDITEGTENDAADPHNQIWNLTWFPEPVRPLADNAELYADDQGIPQVHTVYLTVLPADYDTDAEAKINTSGLSDFAAMNQISDYLAPRPVLPAIFIDGDDPLQLAMAEDTPGPELINAEITLRGHSTMRAAKKSYKIRLGNNTSPWLGQTTLNLNKHPNDESRIRNKVAFELFRTIPDLSSMRTCFVQLYIRDLSDGSTSGDYTDYGLFTHIEQPGRQFLKDHNLDEYGSLYKANYFEFLPNSALKDITEPQYDQAAFEQILEICAGKTHDKLLRMLADVNDESLDIDMVLDRHFNRDNYFTWLAVNILLANYDTQTQNYLLYSPHDSLTWYFLPWDYDGSMVRREMRDPDGNPAQLIGVANYWNTKLHSRVFSRPQNVEQLNKKIDEIYQLLKPEVISGAINRSVPLIEKYYLDDPDFCKEFTAAEFQENIDCMRTITELNYQLYHAAIEKPMPIFLGIPEQQQKELTLFWTPSFDLQGDSLTYDLQIATDKLFTRQVLTRSGLRTNCYTVALGPGKYYWRVMVRDENGNSQRAFDIYWDDGEPRNIHTGIYGVSSFSVQEEKDNDF